MKKIAVFLDRDGVVNEEVNLLTKPEQIKLIDGVAEGIKLLNKNEILTIIVTNQPVVARNLITEEQLKRINEELLNQLKKRGAHIDALYYCPHHPEKNHLEANNLRYRKECECRKPKTGMIKKATKRFKINTNDSYVIGDQTVDIQLGKNAGCKTILVETGYGGRDNKYDVVADYYCKKLLNACNMIIKLTKGAKNDNLTNSL